MNTIAISPKQDFLDRVGNAPPVKALAELIWNSLDALAKNVEVTYELNALGGLDKIIVEDDGTGIDGTKVVDLFGAIGESWKRSKDRFGGRSLHGNKGEGRFKAFALGNNVEWQTTYKVGETYNRYTILGRGNPHSFTYSDSTTIEGPTGTKVVISSLKDKGLDELLSKNAPLEFAKIFVLYLCKNPNVQLTINGQTIIPSDYCHTAALHSLPAIVANGRNHSVVMEILEWFQPVERGISLCDASGIELHTVEAKLRAKGLNFTIQIKSDYFVGLNKENRLVLEELEPVVRDLLEGAREYARSYVRTKKAEEQASIVAQWKAEDIYPYTDKSDLSAVEKAERQVFDIIGVNVEDYLPEFERADQKQKKFTFKLLAQAIANNPESLQTIISDVLDLKKNDQDDLAELLKKTNLTSVIKAAKTVANRLNFLTGLKNLLFDKDTKRMLLERDQLHKILEKEAWVFDENFALTVSEATLEEVLNAHLALLGKRCDGDESVTREDGRHGRVDLMFSLVNRPKIGLREHLVVELKRPSKKIDSEVLSQIQSYALTVAKDPRFDKATTHWKFIAVSDELDDYAKDQAHQQNRPEGLVFINKDASIEIWALEWTTILHDAEARLEFINQTLNYNADRESAKEYINKTHERFIPKLPNEMESAQGKQEVVEASESQAQVD